jgi:phosphoenolpyruvate synthase/pyruvate phosphate dikinase
MQSNYDQGFDRPCDNRKIRRAIKKHERFYRHLEWWERERIEKGKRSMGRRQLSKHIMKESRQREQRRITDALTSVARVIGGS